MIKKLIRLIVMATISHEEYYYREEASRVGLDYLQMTVEQICFWKASLKAIEADALIHAATKQKPADMGKVVDQFPTLQKRKLGKLEKAFAL